MATQRIYVVKNSPNTAFIIEADWVNQNQAENYSTLGIWVIARNGPSGSTSSFHNGEGYQNVWADGYVGEHRGNPFLPSGYAQNQTRWVDYFEKRFYHDSEGWRGGVSLAMELGYGSISDRLDNGRGHMGYIDAPPRIPKPPTAPRNLRAVDITPTNAAVQYDGPADHRGAPVTGYTADWHEINGSNPLVWRDLNSFGYTSPQGGAVAGSFTPKPGTTYHVYIYARNSAGNGAAASIALTTLPSSPPGISVQADLSGTSSTVSLTPPGGVTGVSRYNIEYRPLGASTATAVSTTSASRSIAGLAPGTTYQYRASAVIGGYTSPWSEWILATQPAPNTNPGDYFDGTTTAKPDTTYAWDGDSGLSTSRATSKAPLGWLPFESGAADSGGTGVVIRATGGRSGSFAARVTFFTDAVDEGFIAGTDGGAAGAAVESSTIYTGSIHVKLMGRAQRLTPGIAWYDDEGNLIEYSWATHSDIPADSGQWVRLACTARSPEGARSAGVVVKDVRAPSGFGSGPFGAGPFGGPYVGAWSPWLGGDSLLLDDAMVTLGRGVPYFDGSTPDVPGYDYQWLGAEHASASVRLSVPVPFFDPLADPDCEPLPAAPRPPIVPTDCITEVGVWRRYAIQIPQDAIQEWRTALPTITLATGDDAERQVRIRVFPNPDGEPVESLDTTSGWVAEQILTYIPPRTTVTIDAVARRAWASVNGADPIPADHLLYGTGGAPASWPELSCGYGYYLTLDVPLDAPSGNLQSSLQITQRM